QEGRIIELAVELHRSYLAKLAAELLSFYWNKSEGGTRPLHACYGASTGASLIKRAEDKLATDSEMTASAQLAIAQAAFCLATAAGDTNALTLGNNLLELLLKEFRPDTNEMAWPRGIANRQVSH